MSAGDAGFVHERTAAGAGSAGAAAPLGSSPRDVPA